MKRGLYNTSIGAWRRYNSKLGVLKSELLRLLPVLKAKNLVPHTDTMNWELDEKFNYGLDFNKLAKKYDAESEATTSDTILKHEKIEKRKNRKKNKENKREKKIMKKTMQNDDIYDELNNGSATVTVAFIVPVTSNGLPENIKLTETPLFKILLSSMVEVYDQESKWARMIMYLGYDENDPLFDNDKVIQQILDRTEKQLPFLTVRFLRLKGLRHLVAHIWSALASVAYQDGADYYCILSDDSQLLNKGWLHSLVYSLQNNPILSNFGTVAFYEEHKRLEPGTFPTFPFFHKTHLQIFGHNNMIHPHFANSFADPYISDLYSIFGSAKIVSGAKIKNIIGGEDMPRYNPAHPGWDNYIDLVQSGRRKIAVWLAQNKPGSYNWTPASIAYGREGLHYLDYCSLSPGCQVD